MLISFTFENYLSFKDRSYVTFEGTGVRSKSTNYNLVNRRRILRSITMYGANASGKSNVVNAFEFAVGFITNSSSLKPTSKIHVRPFLLDEISESNPSNFIFEFFIEKNLYRYSFSLSRDNVLSERLELFNSNDELYFDLYFRDKNSFKLYDNFTEYLDIKEKTRNNALFLSTLAQWNSQLALKILNWFDKINFYTNDILPAFGEEIANLLSEKCLDMIKAADLGIESISVDDRKIVELPDDMPTKLKELILSGQIKTAPTIKAIHAKYNEEKVRVGEVEFNFMENESDGTKKFITILPLLLYTFMHGGILVVDELENYLHPLLVRYIINLFHNKDINKNAQLLLTSHDASLLDSDIFRKDQLYIVSKDKYGVSEIYSLTDFENINQINKFHLSKYYLGGKFGGVPRINKLKHSLF